MKTYDTMVEAIDDLKAQGYTLDFNLTTDAVHCRKTDIRLHPDDFEIMSFYRFEGDTNPDDEAIVYAIASKDGQHKGLLIAAFGPYADTLSTQLLKKLNMHHEP